MHLNTYLCLGRDMIHMQHINHAWTKVCLRDRISITEILYRAPKFFVQTKEVKQLLELHCIANIAVKLDVSYPIFLIFAQDVWEMKRLCF